MKTTPRRGAKVPASRSSTHVAKRGRRIFPIVGIGASAGGLEAFTQLFELIPPDTEMAFVVIQHLDPTHGSFLVEALRKATAMNVSEAADGEHLRPNNVYVIPPNADIEIDAGAFQLLPREAGNRTLHLPVDFFLRSLAREREAGAIGVVMSGNASDGTEGLRAIREAGGITLAQDPKAAKFDGMPSNAIAAGVVDHVLPVPLLARELVRLSRHPYLVKGAGAPEIDEDQTLLEIFKVVRRVAGIDFGEYKSPTFKRRLARRMALRQIETAAAYLTLLGQDADEILHLYEDVLIHVTSFFRDTAVFAELQNKTFPAILKNKAENDPIRLWVAGCSTGEEAYSIAICLHELLGASSERRSVQIFGSDVSERVITIARHGVYSEAAMKTVSEERRNRYFTKVESGYRINKTVRDSCVFVRHDLARDPPFSKIDLISCRNVLIYFDRLLQKRVVPIFHYALNPGGYLLLGRTESISGFAQLFSVVDKANKVFERSAATSALRFEPRTEAHPALPVQVHRTFMGTQPRGIDVSKYLDKMLLARYAPPAILINSRLVILQFRGDLGPYLRLAQGEPQTNLMKMARPALAAVVRAAMIKSKRQMTTITVENVESGMRGSPNPCQVVVVPFTRAANPDEQLFTVLFEQPARRRPARATPKGARAQPHHTEHLRRLEHELAATQEYLESLIDDQERTNEELNSANEELVSGNEELQSLNEELETAKEELQSTNEELVTVNDELHNRNQEAAEINSDLVNLLSTVDVPILMLDMHRRIRRFTPKARSLLNIEPSDVGRPLADIKSSLRVTDIDAAVASVIERNEMHESEVQDLSGAWFRMQVRPYRTTDNRLNGATVSLVDIDTLKRLLTDARNAKADADRANTAKDEFLAMLSHEIRTPLFSMLMQAELLRGGRMDEAKVKRAGEVIERGTLTQVKLIDDLLDVSRIVAGKLKIDLRPLTLPSVVEGAVQNLSAAAKRKRITVEVIADAEVGPVLGDATRLQQVVTNLLANAIKFSGNDSKVTCTLDTVGPNARIEVADTGSGIEPEFLPSVFARFTQEDGTTVRRHGGLGLGLAIVRHLVEAHGGTVEAASAGKGMGATFSVLLPMIEPGKNDPIVDVVQAAAELAKNRFDAARDGNLLAELRVLVVDDDAGAREVISEMLRQLGADVVAASCVSEAFDVIRMFHPEVILCDLAMPEEDGLSFIRRVRALGARHGGNVPALALTALAGDEDVRLALEAGFNMHIAKPVGIGRLASTVARLAHRQPRGREAGQVAQPS